MNRGSKKDVHKFRQFFYILLNDKLTQYIRYWIKCYRNLNIHMPFILFYKTNAKFKMSKN